MEILHPRITPHYPYPLRSQNLTYYQEARKLNRRQARWSLYPSEFDVKLIHTPGGKMVQSDALSCRPDFVPHEDNDNEDITMLPDSLFVNLIYLYLQQQITNCDDLDTDATKALKLLVQSGPTNVQRGLDNWTTETVNGKHVLFFKGKTIFLKTLNYVTIL
jgi:hypothetical protein